MFYVCLVLVEMSKLFVSSGRPFLGKIAQDFVQKPGRCVQWSLGAHSKCFSSGAIQQQRASTSIDISGVYPPITTPFNKDDEIDYKRLEENFHTWNSIDFAGFHL